MIKLFILIAIYINFNMLIAMFKIQQANFHSF